MHACAACLKEPAQNITMKVPGKALAFAGQNALLAWITITDCFFLQVRVVDLYNEAHRSDQSLMS